MTNTFFCSKCGEVQEKMLHNDGRLVPYSKLTKEDAYAEGIILYKIMTIWNGNMLCRQCYNNSLNKS